MLGQKPEAALGCCVVIKARRNPTIVPCALYCCCASNLLLVPLISSSPAGQTASVPPTVTLVRSVFCAGVRVWSIYGAGAVDIADRHLVQTKMATRQSPTLSLFISAKRFALVPGRPGYQIARSICGERNRVFSHTTAHELRLNKARKQYVVCLREVSFLYFKESNTAIYLVCRSLAAQPSKCVILTVAGLCYCFTL